MSKIMQTTGANLPAKEIKGQRVVSYKQIAELHQTQEANLRNNFKRNKRHFIEGVDFFNIRERPADSINLLHTKNYFTESGYLMLVKSLTDDLSWEVQRMLVNSYFRASLLEQVLAFLPGSTRMLMYYRGLGLTQVETGKLLNISKDVVQREEKKLKALGYRAPVLKGKRSGSYFSAPQVIGGTEPEQLEVQL